MTKNKMAFSIFVIILLVVTVFAVGVYSDNFFTGNAIFGKLFTKRNTGQLKLNADLNSRVSSCNRVQNCTGTAYVLGANDEFETVGSGPGTVDEMRVIVNAIDNTGTVGSVLFSAGDTTNSINEGDKERINGVNLLVEDVFLDAARQPKALVIVCDQTYCTSDKKVQLRVRDSTVFNGKTLVLNAIEDRSALVSVDDVVGSIDENDRTLVNGLELYVNSIFTSRRNSSVVITLCGPSNAL